MPEAGLLGMTSFQGTLQLGALRQVGICATDWLASLCSGVHVEQGC